MQGIDEGYIPWKKKENQLKCDTRRYISTPLGIPISLVTKKRDLV